MEREMDYLYEKIQEKYRICMQKSHTMVEHDGEYMVNAW